jgi:hypothetical protein
MPQVVFSSSLRTFIGAIVLLVPATALAVDNGNLGTPQNDCERAATNDYYANYENCKTYLAGDPQSIAQCQTDAAYDYNDAIAACKKQAALGGGRHGVFNGNLDNVFETMGTETTTPKMSVKKGLSVFGRS